VVQAVFDSEKIDYANLIFKNIHYDYIVLLRVLN